MNKKRCMMKSCVFCINGLKHNFTQVGRVHKFQDFNAAAFVDEKID